jgi:hypothetical protein
MPLDHPAVDNVSGDTISDWMRQYSSQKRKCDEENGVLRALVKRAKSDGINAKEMIAAVAAGKLDPDEVARDLRDRLRYMSLRRIPLDRDSLFAWSADVTQKTQAEDDTWAAEDAGYQAGRHGVPAADSPFAPGTELSVRWLEFWHKGQAAIARELGQHAEVASTAKRRPTRRPVEAPVVKLEPRSNGRGRGRRAAKQDNVGIH